MSNKRRNPLGSYKVVMLVITAFLTLFLGLYFLIVFVPLVVYYLWDYHSKIQELERRLADMEPKPREIIVTPTESSPPPMTTTEPEPAPVSTEK